MDRFDTRTVPPCEALTRILYAPSTPVASDMAREVVPADRVLACTKTAWEWLPVNPEVADIDEVFVEPEKLWLWVPPPPVVPLTL